MESGILTFPLATYTPRPRTATAVRGRGMDRKTSQMNRHKHAATPRLLFAVTIAAAGILAAGCSTPDAPATTSAAPATTAPVPTASTTRNTTAAATVPGEKPPVPLGLTNPPAGQPNHMSPEMQAQLERYKGQAANKK